ncbi:ATP-dependent endonuclease [Gammaproteobacteria bacterium ESL0073]|nr:ATP-dependent endonuclease [Gammaproteobacteria bacterium ESL0073]
MLQLIIDYDENDDLSNINQLMMSLDENQNKIVLQFEYVLDEEKAPNINDAFSKYVAQRQTSGVTEKNKLFHSFMERYQSHFFNEKIKSRNYDALNQPETLENTVTIKRSELDLNEIINFRCIDAKRLVGNDTEQVLSQLAARYYEYCYKNKRFEELEAGQEETEIELEQKLAETDASLTSIYDKAFDNVFTKIKQMGIKDDAIELQILSRLKADNLLKDNTKVKYLNEQGHQLPENFNGLGYLNLLNILFSLEIIITEFKRDNLQAKNTFKKPANINILFIEEPEAHTHPQMQYIFIDRIQDILKEMQEGSKAINLQTIISTHSSHIVAKLNNYEQIRYFRKNKQDTTVKHMKDLESEYNALDSSGRSYRFLKQYLTLNSAELLFADKAIFIEGTTERLLLPTMMKKIDLVNQDKTPLLSQHISIVEVGAHSQLFAPLIAFLEIRSLIITDLDISIIKPAIKDGKPVCAKDGTPKMTTEKERYISSSSEQLSTNTALEHFFPQCKSKALDSLVGLSFENKLLIKSDNKWISDQKGYVRITYQVMEEGYLGSSFEDAFFHLNRNFMIEIIDKEKNKQIDKLEGLKNRAYFTQIKEDKFEYDAYDLAEHCVNRKPALAIDILLNTDIESDNWQVPLYIKEGLQWLQN